MGTMLGHKEKQSRAVALQGLQVTWVGKKTHILATET